MYKLFAFFTGDADAGDVGAESPSLPSAIHGLMAYTSPSSPSYEGQRGIARTRRAAVGPRVKVADIQSGTRVHPRIVREERQDRKIRGLVPQRLGEVMIGRAAVSARRRRRTNSRRVPLSSYRPVIFASFLVPSFRTADCRITRGLPRDDSSTAPASILR